jgi:hypothetical protein
MFLWNNKIKFKTYANFSNDEIKQRQGRANDQKFQIWQIIPLSPSYFCDKIFAGEPNPSLTPLKPGND